MATRDHALDLIGSMGATSEWLNKLDRLFAAVHAAVVSMPASTAKDEAIAAISAFRLEFYGADDGADHPDAVAVSGEPNDVTVSGLPDNAVIIVVGYPLEEDDAANAAKYDHMAALARQLVATFPDPKPHVLLNPGNTYKIEAFDAELMASIGWRRA